VANFEGHQKDTLPVQAYGLDGLVIRKVAVDADGKVKITGITDRFVENGNTLELWWNGSLVHSWTVVPAGNVGKPMGLLLSLTYAA
jgi:hypothetical protein